VVTNTIDTNQHFWNSSFFQPWWKWYKLNLFRVTNSD
jgi:hypothetical protein